MKSGIKSTEFWLNLVGLLGGIVLASGGTGTWTTIVGGVLSAVCGASYTMGRSLVKGKEALGHAHVAASQTPTRAKKSSAS